MGDDNLIAVAAAMWEAIRRPDNPQLPVAITYEQLSESDRNQLLKMASAAISSQRPHVLGGGECWCYPRKKKRD